MISQHDHRPVYAALLWLALSGISAVAAGAECRVELVGKVPTLIINGSPHSGFCYSTYDTSRDNLERRVGQFAAAGCDVFNFVVEISGYGYSRPLWPEKDRWDFSDLDDRARRILAVSPAAWLLPRIYIDAPAWWRAENPAELMVLDDGSTSFGEKLFALSRADAFPSLASEKWRADMQFALRTIIDHVDQSDYGDRVIGYQLSGQKTEEWYHWSMNCERLGDYSLPMQQAFRDWLSTRYATDQQLQAAWRRPQATLATAAIPTRAERIGDRTKTLRDVGTERHVIDFHTLWSEIMADTIDLFARTVKEETDGKKIVGAFYAYTFEFADLAEDAGHLALGKLLTSPSIDFIMAPSSYFNRNLPGQPYFRAPLQSVSGHGKMFWNDFDQVSFKYYDKLKADPALKTWEWQMGLTQTPEQFVWMNRREIGMTLACGVQTAHFDIHGGYYEDPEIMEGVRRLGAIRHAALSLSDRASAAEILLLVDEQSQHFIHFRNPSERPGTFLRSLLSAQVAEMGFVAPYDTALLSDLEMLDTRRYKLVLVLNAFQLDGRERELIRRHLMVDGKTIVWYYAPGYFNDTGQDWANVEQLTGIRIAPRDTPIDGVTVIPSDGFSETWKPRPLLAADGVVVSDDRAESLGVRSDDPSQVVIARRRLPDWISIYSATAPLDATLLKHWAREAGVHIYDQDATHLLLANRHFLMIAADDRADRAAVHLPHAATVADLFTDEVLGRDTADVEISLRPKEVRLFRLDRQ